MTDVRWHVSVLIPARDEEDLLPRCLDSVLLARDRVLRQATCDVIVAVDRSTDSTFAIARRMLAGTGVAIQTDAGMVGPARAAAAGLAMQRRRRTAAQCWLANTDADCCVPPSWLTDQLTLADQDAQAIAGVVDVDSFDEHEELVPERFRSSYIIHPDGTHPHVHGANLGVRADVFLRAGGWASLRTAEDHDLWARLGKTGAARVSTSQLRVITSGRRVGRAPMGFAGALAAHNEAAA